MSGVPPPPPGFNLDPPATGGELRNTRTRARRSASLTKADIPPPPDGYQLDGDVHDGDTFGLEGGGSLRLYGADAPELEQRGFKRDLTSVPIGLQAKAVADGLVDPNGEIGTLHGYSYGRPVAPVSERGADVGQSLIRSGNALAAPKYMSDDPARQQAYMEAERLARQNRLGVHGVYAQTPQDYRHSPIVTPDRETVARWWDTPTPMRGLRPEIEQGYLNINRTGSVAQILKYASDNEMTVDPAKVARFVKARDAGKPVKFEMLYDQVAKPLTNMGDGAVGAAARGVGDGVLPNLLDEAGAIPDTFGLTDGRESVFNSDRRFADIFANNVDQNRAIIGYDEMAHPYARLGGEIGGGLAVPFGAGAKTVPELAKVGALYGGVAGFGGGDTLPERLTGAVINAGAGAVVTAAGGKLIEGAVKGGKRLLGKPGEVAAEGAGEAAEGYADNQLGDALSAPRSGSQRVPDRIDVGPTPVRAPDVPVVPISSARPVRDGRQPDWIDIADIPPPPRGYTLDGNAARAMDADPMPSLSSEPRQRDYLDLGQRTRPLLRDPTEAEMRAATAGIHPSEVLPIPANDIGSVEEAASRDAGRYVEAKAPNEREALTRRTVRNYMGVEVPKVGPIDLIGYLRRRGGLKPDALGELNALGLTNAARKGMDHVGQEHRFGPLINPEGSSLDDAALAAWEEGYFPELSERPDINTFLDALRDTHEGRNRRFLPEDHAEIEAHDALRAERYDLEHRSFEEGAPIYSDRSEAAGPDTPFPPVQAYEEWPAEAVKRAGNINLDKLDSPQDIRRALVTVNNRVGFDAATRGRVTQAETERLASELGMTPESLLSRRKGQALNAEEALAARQILAKSGNELVNAARKIQALDNPGDELLVEFQRKLTRHAALQEQVSGATAEAGRALQQFRMVADGRMVRKEVLAALVNRGGGADRIKGAAETLIDAVESEPGKFNTLAKQMTKPGWQDKFAELYINALLTAPPTHIVNTVSNTLTALAQLPEHAAASMLGGARAAVGRGEDRVLASELGARAFGLLQGTKEGIREFARTMRTGEPSDFASKVEAQANHAISGIKGSIIRTPTRMLSAEDELFKGMARRMELNGLAVRKAHKEGLRGEAAKARIAELVANPTNEMLERAFDYGRYLTFQRPLGALSGGIARAKQEVPLLNLVVTFVRTPTNLLKFAIERSPGAPLIKEWRKDFAAGGARRDLAVAKALVGTGFGAAIYEAALQGKVTGSAPTDEAKNRFQRADGWQPYSFKIGGKYYSYSRLDPFATTIGVAADLATKANGMSPKQLDEYSMLLVASIMKNLGDKTWLSGASDFIEAISDPQRYGPSYLRRMAASVAVPNIVGQTARTLDPVSRDTQNVGDELQSRLPGLSSNLPAKRDIWGAPVTSEGGLGPDWLSPIRTSTAKDDSVNREMLAIGARFDVPQRKLGSGPTARELSPEEYEHYSALAGQNTRTLVEQLMRSPGWSQRPADQRASMVKKAAAKGKSEARSALFGGASPQSTSSRPASVPPPPPGFVEGEAGGVNVYRDIQQAIPGIRFTSGFRTPAYQEDMRRRGYHPDPNSGHLDGSKLDLLPPPGKSMDWLKRAVKRFRPDVVLNNEGDHLDARFPGYYGAPAIGNARKAGLRNPLEGMPPPPPGFSLDPH